MLSIGPQANPGARPAPIPTTDRRLFLFLAAMLAATVAFGLAVAWGMPLGIRGEWVWRREILIGSAWMAFPPLVPLLAPIPFLVKRARRGRMTRRLRAITALWYVFFCYVFQLALSAMVPHAGLRAGAVIASPVATSYFNEALKVDSPRRLMADYVQIMPRLPWHARTHPPGPILFFWAINRLVRASPALQQIGEQVVSQTLYYDLDSIAQELRRPPVGVELSHADLLSALLAAYLLPLLGSLGMVPLLFLARDLAGEEAAIYSVALAALIPGVALFLPEVDQLVLLLAICSLWAFHSAWQGGRAGWLLGAGALAGVGIFTSLGLLALIPLTALWVWLSRERWRPILWWLGGIAGLFLLLFLLLRFNLPAVLWAGLAAHRRETTQVFPRTYHKWLWYNLVDFFTFLGLPLAFWLGRILAGERFGLGNRDQASRAVAGLAAAWLMTLVLLDLSGVVRGEVGRIWMFLMPPAAIFAARQIVAVGKRAELALFLTVLGQFFQVVIFRGFLRLFSP